MQPNEIGSYRMGQDFFVISSPCQFHLGPNVVRFLSESQAQTDKSKNRKIDDKAHHDANEIQQQSVRVTKYHFYLSALISAEGP
jgi:hypothetical protein